MKTDILHLAQNEKVLQLYLQNICRLMSHLLIKFFSLNLRMKTGIDISLLHNTLHLAQNEKVLQEIPIKGYLTS